MKTTPALDIAPSLRRTNQRRLALLAIKMLESQVPRQDILRVPGGRIEFDMSSSNSQQP